MQQRLYHGILVDMAFTDRLYPKTFPIFAERKSGDWSLYGIKIHRNDLEKAVSDIQLHMRADKNFYSHVYDDETVIAIFKERIFRVTSHESSWKNIRQYGKTLGIPAEQLDFWPNRFQDEIHYFAREDFVEGNPR